VRYLDAKDILEIHKFLSNNYGLDDILLQPDNLDIAIDSPKRTVFGNEIYKSINEKAAILMSNLIKLHPFLDGNKRVGFLSTVLFLERNSRELTSSTEEEVQISKQVAICTADTPEITEWLNKKVRRLRLNR
jgi:death-on-curing protein